MTAVLVDTNVLLDVMTEDKIWMAWSSEALEVAAESSRLVINAIIYAEASIRFARIEDLEEALPQAMLEREPLPFEAEFLAGEPSSLSETGQSENLAPSRLPYRRPRRRRRYRLLTRDAARYRTYFPKLPLITPDAQ